MEEEAIPSTIYQFQIRLAALEKRLNGNLRLKGGVAWKEKVCDKPRRRKSMARRTPRPRADAQENAHPVERTL